MVTVMESVNLYTFAELSEEAKDAAAQWYGSTAFDINFAEYIDTRLAELFPNSEPEALYDFGCTQGSGFDIVGTFDIVDLLKLAGYNPADPTEYVLNPWRDVFVHRRTDRYTYCTWGNAKADVSDYLYMETFSRHLTDDAAEKICDAMQETCSDLMQAGWDELDYYRTPDAHGDTLYTADGTFWGYQCDIKTDAA